MSRNTHDRLHDHFSTDLDTNVTVSADVANSGGTFTAFSSGSTLHDALVTLASHFLWGTADPSAGGGIAAVPPAFYVRDNAGATELWAKTGAADTSWSKVTIP